MFSTRPLISTSSSPFTNPSGIVLSTPITIGITAIFMFHSFSQQLKLMVFSWSLRDSKSHRLSWTLLRILDNPNNSVVLIVSALPPIFNYSKIHSITLVTDPNARTKLGIIVNGIFLICLVLFLKQGSSIVYLFTILDFHSMVRWNGEIHKTCSPFLWH